MGDAMELHSTELLPHLQKDCSGEKDEEFDQRMDLPHDLITHCVFIRLPIKSLLQFKSVSKAWYSTLSSPHFGNAHLKFSPLLYQPTCPVHCLFIQSGCDYFIYSCEDNVDECGVDCKKGLDNGEFDVESNKGLFRLGIDFDGLPKDKIVIGSCNGLVCLYSLMGYLIILNPVINQWVKFSCPLVEGCKNSSWGFGYVSCIDDYKVVRMSEVKLLHCREIIVDVFSFRTRKWKRVYDKRLDQYVIRGASASAGLLVGESLYWIMHRQGSDYEQDILGYDLVLDRLKIVSNLIPADSYLGCVRFLCCMGGCLSTVRFTNRGDMSVSIVKQCGQVDYIGLYRELNLKFCCGAVGFTTEGKFFIQLGERELGLVNPNSSPKVYTKLVRFEGTGFIDIKNYVPSLVSPFSLTETQL